MQSVPHDKIVVIEGRHRDIDHAFYPRHSRTQDCWVRIDQAYYEQVALPPVQLLKVGELYFVRDGHHRVSASRARQHPDSSTFWTSVPVVRESMNPRLQCGSTQQYEALVY